MSSNNDEEEIIDDDEEETSQQKQAEKVQQTKIEQVEDHQPKHEQEYHEKVDYPELTSPHRSESPKKGPINHEEIGIYANDMMELEEEQSANAKLKIIGIETKGSTLSKYTSYIIKGSDKNGEISISRRFSQFHALRTAMVRRWPGCFVPSIPSKNFFKNDKDEIVKRERYLNDFLNKMTKILHLYNSQEFQTFLRSKEADISNIYNSWSNPTSEAIINKYRDCFGELAGKQIDSSTNSEVSQFYARVLKNQTLFERYRVQVKNLALSKDRFNQKFPQMFDKVFPNYEKVLLLEYANGRQDQLVYLNTSQAKLCEQASIAHEICSKNPFWLLYDLIKHEERDGRAFIQSLESKEALQNKRNALESKIKENEKAILELTEGKKNMKSMTTKGTNEEIKYKIEVETEELKKEKDYLGILCDIISALIVYIEIPAYQQSKTKFYCNTLKKIGGYEINTVQICGQIWTNTAESSKKISQSQEKL